MASSDTATASATYREVFDNPVFRLLFGANLAAVLGTTLRMVALSLLVYDVTGSAFLTALTYGIAFAPQAIGGVLLGALPDRICPRALIAAGHGLECAVGAVVALAPCRSAPACFSWRCWARSPPRSGGHEQGHRPVAPR